MNKPTAVQTWRDADGRAVMMSDGSVWWYDLVEDKWSRELPPVFAAAPEVSEQVSPPGAASTQLEVTPVNPWTKVDY